MPVATQTSQTQSQSSKYYCKYSHVLLHLFSNSNLKLLNNVSFSIGNINLPKIWVVLSLVSLNESRMNPPTFSMGADILQNRSKLIRRLFGILLLNHTSKGRNTRNLEHHTAWRIYF